MAIFFAALSAVLLVVVILQRIRYQKLQGEINYISNRLETVAITDENGFVLLPTDNSCIKRLGVVLNVLLQDFYEGKAGFARNQKAMAQVLTNISHDIRTPLTVLKGNSEMLVAETEESVVPKNVQAMARKIDQKADDLVATISDYFTMAKITSGDFQVQMERENISGLCRDIILDYYNLLDKQQFEVDIQIPDTPVFAYTDRGALERIVKNLIDNAIQHGGDGRYLSLRLTTKEGKCAIEIEDHGKGISSHQQKLIFARNYTTAAKSSGSGLGLAISRHLAGQIGAKLQVRSIPGERTIFSIIMKS